MQDVDSATTYMTYLQLIKLQRLRDADQFLHLSHLSNLSIALVNDLFKIKQRLRSFSRDLVSYCLLVLSGSTAVTVELSQRGVLQTMGVCHHRGR